MKKYVIVMVEREDWDSEHIFITTAENEGDAYDKFAFENKYTVEELEEGEQDGEIVIHIKEIV